MDVAFHRTSSYLVDKYSLWGYDVASDYSSSYFFEQYSSTIPSSVNIPTSSATASYNAANQTIHDVSVSGAADFVLGYWYYGYGPENHDWSVFATVGTDSLMMPDLPDSISALLGIAPASFVGEDIRLEDYDAFQDLDGCVNKVFRTPDLPMFWYNSWYWCTQSLGSGLAGPQAWEEPRDRWTSHDPLHRRSPRPKP